MQSRGGSRGLGRRGWIALGLGVWLGCGAANPGGDQAKAAPVKAEVGGVIRVIGNSAPELRSPSVHVAQQDAGKAAAEDVKAQLDAFATGFLLPDGSALGAKREKDAAAKARIDAALAGYKVVDTLYFSDGAMDVIAELPVESLIAAAKGDTAPKRAAPVVEVILDARRVTGYRPAANVRLLRKDGSVLLESKGLPAPLSFATSMDGARGLSKGKPLVVELEAGALVGGELVIPAAEAERVKTAGLGGIAVVLPVGSK